MFPLLSGHKKFIIGLLVLFVLLWVVTAQLRGGRFTFLERPALAAGGVIERSVAAIRRSVVSVWQGYVFLVRTERENRRLKEEIDRLRIENQLVNELLLENERLRAAVEFQKRHPRSSIVVQVIARDISPSSSTVVINKGSASGIEKGMAVITPDGVVGKVQAVADNSARVILLTDPANTVAVRVERNREEGLLEGKIVGCAMKYVSYYADVQEGDMLVSSGLDGIYPKGLPVAVVIKVSKDEASPFQSVSARPVVSFSRLEEALVLKP